MARKTVVVEDTKSCLIEGVGWETCCGPACGQCQVVAVAMSIPKGVTTVNIGGC